MQYDEDLEMFKCYLREFVNKTEEELIEITNLRTNAKSKLYMLAKLICTMFRGKDYFKAICNHDSVILKTIQLKPNGKPKEAMSFPAINYVEMMSETWDDSSIKYYFQHNKFLFFIFKKDENGFNRLIKISLWKMPISDLEGELKITWYQTYNMIASGNIINRIEDNKVITNFPREKDTKCFHIRPHGSLGSDICNLPVEDKVTGYSNLLKHSFWFNHSYIEAICVNSKDI